MRRYSLIKECFFKCQNKKCAEEFSKIEHAFNHAKIYGHEVKGDVLATQIYKPSGRVKP